MHPIPTTLFSILGHLLSQSRAGEAVMIFLFVSMRFIYDSTVFSVFVYSELQNYHVVASACCMVSIVDHL